MSYPLKYIFTAEFKDGTQYQQSPDDMPRIADRGSSFTDIISRLDDIVSFSVIAVADATRFVGVDLLDGSFTISKLPFTSCNPSCSALKGTKLDLVYFRQVTRSIVSGSGEESLHVSYHIGWHTMVNGRVYQQTVAVD